ncbi:MAG TPA: D-glucuronyl C5-epimerase family protein [Solirubrobacteraceae bacterium]|nr:D-glucuronyl C5-epimerase family protein [Solirubrobacteraceae bacterium]
MRLIRFAPPATPIAAPAGATAARARTAGPSPGRGALDKLRGAGAISAAQYDQRVKDLDDALFIRNQLSGTRRRELDGVLGLMGGIAARGQLDATRLHPLWLQLNRNVEWWGFAKRLPSSGERVRFRNSRVLFQYFPGQGLQLHPLANWGRASSLIRDGYKPNAREFLAELLPLAAERDGAMTWEYYFNFGGGSPPWTSGLSQGTALVALSRSYRDLGDEAYLRALRSAVRLFSFRTPLGVRVPSRWGNHYAEYSFAPRLRIVNGYIQALNGLWDARPYTTLARTLFVRGDRQARRELPAYDTGRWSFYSNNRDPSPLNYHVLLRDFLRGLCERTGTRIYCVKASRFTAYLRRGQP